MKDFPTLKDAEIQLSLTQPQAKLLITILSYFYESVDTKVSINCENPAELVEAMQKHIISNYNFTMPYGLCENPENLNNHTIDLLEDKVQEAYFQKQFELQDLFNLEVQELAKDIDPEIFNLRPGQSIQVDVDNQVLKPKEVA